MVAGVVALLLQRRRTEPPTAPTYRAPTQLDRDDFDDAAAASLIVVFASTACNSCPVAWSTVNEVAGDRASTSLQRVDVESSPTLHKRYKIDGVPTTVVANAEGVVTASYFGPPDADALRGAL